MADLLAYQFDDADDGEAIAQSREDRKRRAFLASKASYPTEPVVVQPGWFMGSENDLEDFSPERDAKEIVLVVQHLYLSREYQRTLDVSLAVLDKMVAEDASSRKPSSHSRELQDMALRSAIRLGRGDLAAQLADSTISRWEAMPGSAASAGEAYLLANRPYDAVSALILAINGRPHLYRYVSLLAEAFGMLQHKMTTNSAKQQDEHAFNNIPTSLVHTLRTIAKGKVSADDAGTRTDFAPASETELTTCMKYLGLNDDQVQQVLQICAMQHDKDGAPVEEETLRSVRSL